MKKIVAIAIAFMGMSGMAQAQGGGDPPPPPPPGMGRGGPPNAERMQEMQKRRMEMMFKGITLTDAQKSKIDSTMKKQGESQRAFMDSARAAGLDREQMRAKMDAFRKAHDDAIKGVLTADQVKVYDKNQEEMKKMMGPGGGMGGGRGRGPGGGGPGGGAPPPPPPNG